MPTVEITLKATIPFKGKVKIVESPNKQENIKVLDIDGKQYMPAFDLMVYNKIDDLPDEFKDEAGSWVSLDFEKFEDMTGDQEKIDFDYRFDIKD